MKFKIFKGNSLLRTRCRYGSPPRVNLATRRRLAGSFFNRHAITPPNKVGAGALTARERPVSGTVSLPSRGTFHHSLTVLVRYRSSGGIQAAEWSRQIHTGFYGPRATGGRARAADRVPPTGLSPAAAPRPRGFGYPIRLNFTAPRRGGDGRGAPRQHRARNPRRVIARARFNHTSASARHYSRNIHSCGY